MDELPLLDEATSRERAGAALQWPADRLPRGWDDLVGALVAGAPSPRRSG